MPEKDSTYEGAFYYKIEFFAVPTDVDTLTINDTIQDEAGKSLEATVTYEYDGSFWCPQ